MNFPIFNLPIWMVDSVWTLFITGIISYIIFLEYKKRLDTSKTPQTEEMIK